MAIDKPLTRVQFLGDIAYGDIRVAVTNEAKKRLNFRSPIVMMGTKGGAYDGEKSPQAPESLSFKTISVSTNTVRFEEFDVQQTRSGTLAAASLTGSTTLDVGTAVAALLRPQDMLHFPTTGMNVRVVSVTQPIDGTLTIERAVGSEVTAPRSVTPTGFTRFTDVDLPISAEFLITAPAVVQYSTARQVRSYNALEIREAATQILRSDLAISRTRMTQQSTDKAKQVSLEERKLQELFYITLEMENMILFGDMIASHGGRINATGGALTTANDAEGNTYTTSDGIFAVIRKYAPANIIPANDAVLGGGTSAVSRAKLDLIAELLDRVGGDHIILASKAILFKVNEILVDPTKTQQNIPFTGGRTDIGNPTLTYQTLFGGLTFQHHPLLDTATKYQKTMLCIRKDNIGLLGLKGAELKWTGDSQENDRDGKAGYFLSELGAIIAYASEFYIFNEWTIT
jgi:hypothetical protein